jgi:hypothetical protein
MGNRKEEYWAWRNRQLDEEDERKRQKKRNELVSSLVFERNTEAIQALLKDEFVTLPSDPPFAKKLHNDMEAKKREILLLIQKKTNLLPTRFLQELAFKIVDIDHRWPDAGDRFDNLREKLEQIFHRYNDGNLKIFIMDVQLLLMDLVMMHGRYLEKTQEWNRSSWLF